MGNLVVDKLQNRQYEGERNGQAQQLMYESSNEASSTVCITMQKGEDTHSGATCEHVPPPPLWDEPDLPQDIRDELIPAVSDILIHILTNEEYDHLLSTAIYWHPRCPKSIRDRQSRHFCTAYDRQQANTGLTLSLVTLARIVHHMRAQSEVMRLLADRGPDYGLSLLIILDIVFRIAFCTRASTKGADSGVARENRRCMTILVASSSRLLEVLALHTDCAPIAPYFIHKLLLTCMGLLLRHKIPPAALSRFYQLQYFLSPETRSFVFLDGAMNFKESSFLRWDASSSLEKRLWNLARRLSLGQPSSETKGLLQLGRLNGITVRSHLDAMATVFERLNHVAKILFGTSLVSYGSAATGFATQSSDVDVVLQLGAAGVDAMMTQIKRVKEQAHSVDLNPFPSRTLTGFTKAQGDWSWVTTKKPTVAASIWAGRLFAWALHRLYGWQVQCVQNAYVPIVRILGCVGRDGRPRAVPESLRTHNGVETSIHSALHKLRKQVSADYGIDLTCGPYIEMRQRALRDNLSEKQAGSLSAVVAISIVSESQYATWTPSFVPEVSVDDAGLYLRGQLNDPVEKSRVERILYQIGTPCISAVLNQDTSTQFPGLEYPILSSRFDDGRLTVWDGGKFSSSSAEHPIELWLVEADFSADRQVGIHNSRLLRAYASCSPYVVALGLLVKHWAKSRAIGDAFAGYLSGYQWTLLIIHYLQHFFCVPVPTFVTEWADFQKIRKRYGTRSLFVPHFPLLPNLQTSLEKGEEWTRHRVIVVEMEGEVDVSFFQPGLGYNRHLPRVLSESFRVEDPSAAPSTPTSPRQREWPEDRLLIENPLLYAYEQLTSPFELQPDSSSCTTAEGQIDLWRYRLHTAPRPPRDHYQKRTEEKAMKFWDSERLRQRRDMKSLQETEDNSPECLSNPQRHKASTFPSLSSLRNEAYVENYIMMKNDLLITFSNELTLCELLYGFFEYYGLRFNLFTEISDIDRTPDLPCGKKEFFETSHFSPKIQKVVDWAEIDTAPTHPVVLNEAESIKGSSILIEENGPRDVVETSDMEVEHVPQKVPTIEIDVSITSSVITEGRMDGIDDTLMKLDDNERTGAQDDQMMQSKEVLGRGRGAFQFNGRRFLCIRDPFEKDRTIGPPCRSQTHISTELLRAVQLFGTIRENPENEQATSSNACYFVDQLFQNNLRGIHPTSRLWHPTAESLGLTLTRVSDLVRSVRPQGNNLGGESGIRYEHMYAVLLSALLEKGNYTVAFAAYSKQRDSFKKGPMLKRQSERRPRVKSFQKPELKGTLSIMQALSHKYAQSQEESHVQTDEKNSPVLHICSFKKVSKPVERDNSVSLKHVSFSDAVEFDGQAPPGFETYSRQYSQPPCSGENADASSSSLKESKHIHAELTEERPFRTSSPAISQAIKAIVDEHFIACEHFKPNYGHLSSSNEKLGQTWKYSEENVRILKRMPQCQCLRNRTDRNIESGSSGGAFDSQPIISQIPYSGTTQRFPKSATQVVEHDVSAKIPLQDEKHLDTDVCNTYESKEDKYYKTAMLALENLKAIAQRSSMESEDNQSQRPIDGAAAGQMLLNVIQGKATNQDGVKSRRHRKRPKKHSTGSHDVTTSAGKQSSHI